MEQIPDMKRMGECVWEIPKNYKNSMQVPARIIATEKLIKSMDAGVFNQITNVACLPGIQKYAFCMPDGHWGYGFPIGGVAAFDLENGVISPGGIGFDINCGMRLIRTNLTKKELLPKLREVVDSLFRMVPCGVGASGFLRLSHGQFREVMENGVNWCIENGYGWERDASRIEDRGQINAADSSPVSEKAISRGITQLGTLGSGNHYLEIEVVEEGNIFEPGIARKLGIEQPGQVMLMLHCGSRGFGHQIGTDYLRIFEDAMRRYNLKVADRELACAPFSSKEGQNYYKAMACAANTAFANRQVILHRVRECFSKVFKSDPEELGMEIVYDVAHNIAKIEEHIVDGERKKVLVHRKGATRAFGPGHPELDESVRELGQPVILGGSMETGSYLLVGTEKAMSETFGSTAHGSGRTMSRQKAKSMIRGEKLMQDMEKRGIYVRAASMSGLAEEAGIAYKNISDVVETLDIAGISRKVARFVPIGNIKG